MTARAPACFVGHRDPAHLAEPGDPTAAWLARLGRSLPEGGVRGVVAVASSFEAPRSTVTTRDDVALARRVLERLLAGGQPAGADDARPVDPPLAAIAAHLAGGRLVPLVQVSLHGSLDPEVHLAVGRALEPLRDDGIAIVGLGALTRELAADAPRTRAGRDVTGTFDAWVIDLLTRTGPYARSRGLGRFRDHPEAHRAHPRGEHVLPLVVVAGAATSDRSPANVGELAHSTTVANDADGRPCGGSLGLVFRL